MLRSLILILFIVFTLSANGEGRDLFKDTKFDIDSAVPVDKDMALQEVLVRNLPVKPLQILGACRNNATWCEGYITAVIHKLKDEQIEFCLPVNDVGRHNDNAVKSIIESWLYRQPPKDTIRLIDAVTQALTEHKQC